MTVKITFSTEGLEEGDKIVVFEKIYDVATDVEKASGIQSEDILIARHEDINDDDQTVSIHFRPMTGSVVPSYKKAGVFITAVSVVIAVVWFGVTRKKRYGKDG